MSVKQIERNELIVKTIDEGKSYKSVAKMFSRSKSTIANIYWRAKNKGRYARV